MAVSPGRESSVGLLLVLAALAAGVLAIGGAFLGWAYYTKYGPFERAPLDGFVSLNEASDISRFLIFEAAYNGHANALEVQRIAREHCAQFPIDPDYDEGCFIFISNGGEPAPVGDFNSVIANIRPRWERGEIVASYLLVAGYRGGRDDEVFVVDCDVFDPLDVSAITMCKGSDDPIGRIVRREESG